MLMNECDCAQSITVDFSRALSETSLREADAYNGIFEHSEA